MKTKIVLFKFLDSFTDKLSTENRRLPAVNPPHSLFANARGQSYPIEYETNFRRKMCRTDAQIITIK